MERLFLEHTYRWLKPDGVLILVVPGDRLTTCVDVLSVHFRDKAIYRLREPEALRYKQIVLFGVRRTKREREQLKDWDVSRARAKLLEIAGSTKTCQSCPMCLIGNSLFPQAGRHNWSTAGFPWIRWRTCSQVQEHIGRPRASCSRRNCEQPVGR
jgi:hypothetical protein